LVYNNLDIINQKNEIIKPNLLWTVNYLLDEKMDKEYFIKNQCYFSYSSLMCKKTVLQKYKISNPLGDKSYALSDWDLFFQISTDNNCFWINQSLTLYRSHENNYTKNNIWMQMPFHRERLLQIYQKRWLLTNNLINYKMAEISCIKAVKYLQWGKRWQAFKEVCRGYRYGFYLKNIIKIMWIIIMCVLPQRINNFIILSMRSL
jgi:hypothetical protein